MDDGRFSDRHHGNGSVGGQPVRLVVPAGVVADVVEVAEQERHRVEPGNAGAGLTWSQGRLKWIKSF